MTSSSWYFEQNSDNGCSITVELARTREDSFSSFGTSAKPQRARVICRDSLGTTHTVYVAQAVAKRLVLQLKKGLVLNTAAEASLHIETLEKRMIAERIEQAINARDYARKELSDLLLKRGFTLDYVTCAVNHACDVGLINDNRYAALYIRTKLACGWGQTKIAFELKKRGIVLQEVEGWPDAFITGDELYERAYAAALKKAHGSGDIYAKVVRFLASRGYNAQLCYRVARAIKEDTEQN